MALLTIKDLKTHFPTYRGLVKAVDGVTFSINERETLGLVGESGCGKSVTALSILRLVDYPGQIVGGEIWFKNRDILKLNEAEVRRIRGKEIAIVFQDPFTYLNPTYTIGNQIAEVISRDQEQRSFTSNHVKDGALLDALKLVRIPDPDKAIKRYPHELSGGMRQRVMIAMALSSKPDLLIADEPTTALDVTIGAQILDLMDDLKNETGSSMLFVTHNLGIVARVCDRIAVMYLGRIVECAQTEAIFDNPLHPYTSGLLSCVPRFDPKIEQLHVIPGTMPSPVNPPSGCRFRTRCQYATDICKDQPPMFEPERGHFVGCYRSAG